jgi:DNA repair exonuclease SbcCD ATPase subunit
MQNRSNTRSMIVTQSASRNPSQVMQGMRTDSRNRPSNTLRRAGSVLSAELSNSPATTPPSGVAASLTALSSSSTQPLGAVGNGTDNAELPSTPPEDGTGSMSSTCGLTPASLKHLRRQNQKLTDEKETLRKDLENAQVTIRELRERLAALEEQLRESEERQEKLQQELVEAREGEAEQRKRAEDADRLNIRLEESLAAKEAEVARLRQALEEQLQLTKEVCEAAERSSGEARGLAESSDEIARLNEQVKQLQGEKNLFEKERQRLELESAAYQKQTAAAMGAAEKAMSVHAQLIQRMEQLRVAKLSDAISAKTEASAKAKEDTEQAKSDLDTTLGELESLAMTEQDLHNECDWVLRNFAARQKARMDEMEAIGQAKAILSGEQ